MKLLTEQELDELRARIESNADKLIAAAHRTIMPPRDPDAPGKKPLSIENAVLPEMLEVLHAGEDNWPLWVDDVVQGIARLDWYRQGSRSVPLSGKKIVQCFAYLSTIDVYQISRLLQVGERQARRYLKACELAHDRLIAGYCTDSIRLMKYPDVFVYPREKYLDSDLDT